MRKNKFSAKHYLDTLYEKGLLDIQSIDISYDSINQVIIKVHNTWVKIDGHPELITYRDNLLVKLYKAQTLINGTKYE